MKVKRRIDTLYRLSKYILMATYDHDEQMILNNRNKFSHQYQYSTERKSR